jgi:hypothetical protein
LQPGHAHSLSLMLVVPPTGWLEGEVPSRWSRVAVDFRCREAVFMASRTGGLYFQAVLRRREGLLTRRTER